MSEAQYGIIEPIPFPLLHARLRTLERRYNPSRENLHFANALPRIRRPDLFVWRALLFLAKEALRGLQRQKANRGAADIYANEVFYFLYDLFLLIRVIGECLREEEATCSLLLPSEVQDMITAVVELAGFTAKDRGDLFKRTAEALAGVLWGLDDGALVRLSQERAAEIEQSTKAPVGAVIEHALRLLAGAQSSHGRTGNMAEAGAACAQPKLRAAPLEQWLNWLGLQTFDGFPYLITRIVSGLYHINLLPAGAPIERLLEIARLQTAANSLEACLALSRDQGWWFSPGAMEQRVAGIPAGGAIVHGALLLPVDFPGGDESEARARRLAEFSQWTRRAGGFLLGDPMDCRRPATDHEQRTLSGGDLQKVPAGLTRCRRCNELKGKFLDRNPQFRGMVARVHCACENDNLCARCWLPLSAHRLNACFYDEERRAAIHVPGFCGLSHKCPDVSPGARPWARP